MTLTTEGLIEQMKRFRQDKLALVALVGSMGAESEKDALDRLREIIALTEKHLTEARSAHRGRLGDVDRLASDVLELAHEIEPWLAQMVERSAA
jgi:chemotaxis regulatin CheY-phosphate phosphatase CheZ